MEQLITIVTLTYKKFDKLYQAIDSVLSQDYPAIEYIISDDGSPDFPEKVIQRYINERRGPNIVNVQLLTHSENQGTVRNLNDAYRKAKGNIIIPLSADDSFLNPNIISRIVEVYKKRNCNSLLIGRALFNQNGQFVRNVPSKKAGIVLTKNRDNREQYQRFVTGRFFDVFSGCALSFKKEFIEDWGYFDERYILLEDAPFFAQYLWNHYMECAFDIIGIRYNEGGVSSGKKHPLLLKDDEVYRRTDRIAHLRELNWYQRAIVQHEVLRANDLSRKGRMKAALRHPIGFIGIKAYRLRWRLLRD